MLKKLVYLSLIGTFLLTVPVGCNKKYGCPSNDQANYDPAKSKKKSKSKSSLFGKKSRKKMGIR